MKQSKYSEPQILAILGQAEGGEPVAQLCREHGMSSLVLQMACKVWRDGCVDDLADEVC
jgi:hypothetical protein